MPFSLWVAMQYHLPNQKIISQPAAVAQPISPKPEKQGQEDQGCFAYAKPLPVDTPQFFSHAPIIAPSSLGTLPSPSQGGGGGARSWGGLGLGGIQATPTGSRHRPFIHPSQRVRLRVVGGA